MEWIANPKRQPYFLKAGDKVWVISASSKAPEASVNKGIEILQSWGLKPVLGAAALQSFHSLAGEDDQRLNDLQQALDDPDCKAIIFTRGGYGLSRILDKLDWQKFMLAPKWLLGYSDLTALHLACFQMGFQSIHGPMLVQFSSPPAQPSILDLNEILFGKRPLRTFPVQSVGKPEPQTDISGPMIGGNLSLLAHSLGSRYPLQTQGNILFLEEIGEGQYKTDRLLLQLARAGLLQSARAIVLGQFTNCDPGDFPFDYVESVKQLVDGQVPIFYGIPMGHEDLSYAFVHGAECRIYFSENQWIWEQNLDEGIA